MGWFSRAQAAATSVRGVNYATSPLLASKTPYGRSQLVLVVMGLMFGGLLARAVYVQLINPGFFQTESLRRTTKEYNAYGLRGDIKDRHGDLLARSRKAPNLVVRPAEFLREEEQFLARNTITSATKPEHAEIIRGRIAARQKRLDRLLALVNMNEADFRRAMASLRPPHTQVVLATKMGEAATVEALGLRFEGIDQDVKFDRTYPESRAVSHVLGWTDPADKGVDGVEKLFDKLLAGSSVKQQAQQDRLGRIVGDQGENPDPKEGEDLTLTLDALLQAVAYRRLEQAVLDSQAKSGSVVVLDAGSGEVLALSNYPSFDPAAPGRSSAWARTNRALTDAYEPGSTMKPFIVALAIEKGLAHPDQVLDTSAFRVHDRLISDHDHAKPSLTVAQVVQKSSNPGTVRLALKLDDQEMYDTLANLGFGRKPDLGLGGVVPGGGLGASGGRLMNWKRWRGADKATMSYGYSISVSVLQLARAYTALAGNGTLLPLSLVKGQPGGEPVRVFTEATARTMREMLRGTVSPEGTAAKAQPVGYTAAGKTGTAQKLVGGRYSSSSHAAWFAGFSPATQPRVVVAVLIDEPKGAYYGGLVAAPVFKDVVEQALRRLGEPPDMEIKPTALMAQADPLRKDRR
ncbi:peptidoglycan D,D-transpeptidase FtsI family protein [Ideonella livida]|uniref:Penicillin-binding protein 2 n=1 Tax=Ideonella livida TaxID=2707176 RepID=A0A7C9PHQ5_9BURK|nr:penicillin-binding protein 2 [Ideonella livida]NDY92277.1 penicillin-binding protein 2 [Ideonella livida]